MVASCPKPKHYWGLLAKMALGKLLEAHFEHFCDLLANIAFRRTLDVYKLALMRTLISSFVRLN